MNRTLARILIALILIISHQSVLHAAGGYFITDTEGKVISEQSGKSVRVGPADRNIGVYDKNDRKVFDISWDADQKSLVIRGNAVEVKIFDDGRVEKWTSYKDQPEQQPIIIEPIIPVRPKNRIR